MTSVPRGEAAYELHWRLVVGRGSEDDFRSPKGLQRCGRIAALRIDVGVCTEPKRGILFLGTATDRGHAHSHRARKLYAQMSETANALDCNEISGPSG